MNVKMVQNRGQIREGEKVLLKRKIF